MPQGAPPDNPLEALAGALDRAVDLRDASDVATPPRRATVTWEVGRHRSDPLLGQVGQKALVALRVIAQPVNQHHPPEHIDRGFAYQAENIPTGRLGRLPCE